MSASFQVAAGPVPGMHKVREVSVEGRVTYEEAPELREVILKELDRTGTTNLIISLGGVERMDTAGLAVLVECLRLSTRQGTHLLLCSPSDSVLRIFKLAGLHDVLEHCCSNPEETRMKLVR